MKFNLLNIWTLFSLALVASHAATLDVYWKSVLPNSPMPKAIKDIVYTQERSEEKSTAVGDGNGGEAEDPFVAFPPLLYGHYSNPEQLKYYSNVTIFFLENDLHQGTELRLHFTKGDQKATFLPKNVADSIPFSSNKLPQIYNEFSLKSDSVEALDMKQTLSYCEDKAIEGEEKYCATSLESMIDFATTKLGKNVKAVSTEVNAKENMSQKYTIEGAKKLGADKIVACHKMKYAYAVFYCHKTVSSRAYSVSLVGTDGIRAKAVAICHSDTSKWNPKHLAFQMLKVEPGSGPICHFLPEDHVGWVPY